MKKILDLFFQVDPAVKFSKPAGRCECFGGKSQAGWRNKKTAQLQLNQSDTLLYCSPFSECYFLICAIAFAARDLFSAIFFYLSLFIFFRIFAHIVQPPWKHSQLNKSISICQYQNSLNNIGIKISTSSA